jgi:WD40 repeat protein
MKKLFKNLNLNLNLNLILLSFTFQLSLFTSNLFSQNLKDYDPHLYEMIKGGKDSKELENQYKERNSIRSTLLTPNSITDSDPYFGWEGHYGTVYSVAYNNDGTLLASGGSDGTIRIWNTSTGTLINTLLGHTYIVSSVAFSPDGTKLASGSGDHTIKLWNVNTGTLIKTWYSVNVSSVAFSPDGTKLASGSGDNTINLWNVNTGTLIKTWYSVNVSSVAFSPDGTKLASGSGDSTIKLWNVSTGTLLNTLSGHTDWVNSVAFSPDGTKLASGCMDGTIKLWNVSTGTLINTLSVHASQVNSVAFSPDGTKLASGSYSEIKLWNVSTGTLINTLSGHTSFVFSVAFSPDGTKLASGSNDGTIKLWNVSTGTLINTLSGHTDWVNSVTFSPDGTKLASGSDDQTIKLWNVSTGTLINTLSGHTSTVYSVAFSPDGTKLASGSNDGTIKLWNVSTGTVINTLSGHTSYVLSVAFSPDGTKLASGSWQEIKLWNVSTGTLINTLLGHTNAVRSVAFSPDGTKLASGSWQEIKLWNVSTGTLINTLSGHTEYVLSVAFSPDGTKLASGSWDGTIKIWNVSTGTVINTLSGHTNWVFSIAFSPDGTKLASGSLDGTIKIWNVSDGSLSRTIVFDHGYPQSICYNKSGTKIASGGWGYKNLRIYDAGISAPSTPTLSSPSSGTTSIPISTTLSWNSASGATSYTLQVSTSSGFSSYVVNQSGLTSTSYNLNGLLNNTTYYWRVSATNTGGTSSWSNTWSFTTKRVAQIVLSNPILTFSANQYGVIPGTQNITIINGGEENLNWNVSDNATWLDISPISGTNNGSITASVNSTNLTTLNNLAEITITATGANNSPQTVNVMYNLQAYPTSITVSNNINYPSYQSADMYKETDYKLVGIPGNSNLSVSTFLTGSQNTDWKVFWDNGESSNYNLKYDGSSTFQFTTGKAFWILSKNSLSLSRSINSAPITTDGGAVISLHKSWNLITNPFTTAILWTKIKTYNSITQDIRGYSSGGLSTETSLQPYIGYIFDNASNKDKLLIPYKFIFETLQKEELSPFKWIVDIDLVTDEFSDRTTSIGVSKITTDQLNQRKPRLIGKIPMVYFNKINAGENSFYATDIKPEFDNSEIWEFEANTLVQPAMLIFKGISNIPSIFEVFLLDKEKDKVMDLRKDSIYQFTPISSILKFSLIVAKPEIIKEAIAKKEQITEFQLGNNYPNPFNPTTRIPVLIPFTTYAKISIFNTLGKELRTIYNGPLQKGEYTFEWNARDDVGNSLPSGVYLYGLNTNGGIRLSKKMILLK